jgi:hypothetical protein
MKKAVRSFIEKKRKRITLRTSTLSLFVNRQLCACTSKRIFVDIKVGIMSRNIKRSIAYNVAE